MKETRIDWIMFAIAVGLAVFGTMMVYSASAMIAHRETAGATQFTYFYKQAGFTFAGILLMLGVSQIDYRRYNNPYVIGTALLMTLVLLIAVFGFPEINGARRWIRVGSFSLQPSEMAKIALPLFLAYFLTRNKDSVGELKATLLPCLACLGVIGGLVFFEPDLGTTIVLCAIFASVYFAAGARLTHVFSVVAALMAVGAAALYFAPWRLKRLAAFVDPCDPENAAGAGYQVCQSLYAIGSGGIVGEGFAKGQQKLFYLPYPHSDFIFSVVGEELGLIGTLGVVLLFGLLLWRGARAAMNAPDRFGMLLAIGIITGITVQALFNMSVVISILPAKGIPLPFISYGGSSVLVTLCAVGILLSITKFSGTPEPESGSAGKPRTRSKTGLR
ncbi:MAG: putative lipid II flippase FtsW [Pyrinomonadaceae bacterium]|nr:putative lipid II flippase FtsW [Pyrinomonadaceae bacterium]